MTPSNHEEDPWSLARICCDVLGDYSSPIANCVRLLGSSDSDTEKGKILSKCPARAEFSLLRLVRVRSLRAKLYYARKTFDPDWNVPPPRCSDAELLESFSVGELRLVLALILLFRKIARKADSFYWPKLAPKVLDYSDACLRIAEAFPALGTEACLLAGTMRPLAFGAMSAGFPEEFKKYSRHLLQNKIPMDISAEQSILGFTYGHVGALLLQSAGLSAGAATNYFLGCSAKSPEAEDDQVLAIRAATILADSLMTSGNLPDHEIVDSYRTSTFNLEVLTSHINRLRTSGSQTKWLDRAAGDLDRGIG